MGLASIVCNQASDVLCWFGLVLAHNMAVSLLGHRAKVINELESLAVLLNFLVAFFFFLS